MKTRFAGMLLLAVVGCYSQSEQPVAVPQPTDIPADPVPVVVDPIRILAWNIESGGNDPDVIAQQLQELSGYDVYALSEVSPHSLKIYDSALGSRYQAIESRSGAADRLQILFDVERFELVRTEELTQQGEFQMNDGNHRSPLLVHLRTLDGATQFQLTVNHLARRKKELRQSQAAGLREWARVSTVPTIAIGDFNFDYSFKSEKGNASFVEMMRDGIWLWVKPEEWIDTNWSDGGKDGKDDYPDSMLDFAFVAGPAREWAPHCRVIVRPGDFPDDETTSDHRPTELVLNP